MATVYLGLGTNLGDRMDNLRRAVAALAGVVAVSAVSSIYETDPWGDTNQPNFLNLCLRGETELPPAALLEAVKGLEQALGRQPGRRWGPRLIDIDILFYDDLIIEDEQLTIPHPRLPERAFVLVPLADIAANLLHPQRQQTIGDLLADVDVADVDSVQPFPQLL